MNQHGDGLLFFPFRGGPPESAARCALKHGYHVYDSPEIPAVAQ